MSLLIGLGGYAKAGKDTVASILETLPGWVRDYMSRPLEEALLTLDPWVNVGYENWLEDTYDVDRFRYHQWMTYAELHAMLGYDDSKNCLDVRRYLQLLGTEIGRKMFGENVWVDRAFSNVDGLRSQGYNVALTGMRFPNELTALSERDGLSVWVRRPGYGPINAHASDNTLGEADFDFVIDNSSDLDSLYHFVTEVWVPSLESRCLPAAA